MRSLKALALVLALNGCSRNGSPTEPTTPLQPPAFQLWSVCVGLGPVWYVTNNGGDMQHQGSWEIGPAYDFHRTMYGQIQPLLNGESVFVPSPPVLSSGTWTIFVSYDGVTVGGTARCS